MNEIEQYDETFGPSTQVRAIVTMVLVALIALFVFGLAPHFASPEAHAGVIQRSSRRSPATRARPSPRSSWI